MLSKFKVPEPAVTSSDHQECNIIISGNTVGYPVANDAIVLGMPQSSNAIPKSRALMREVVSRHSSPMPEVGDSLA